MKIIKCSANEIIWKCHKKKIVCFGAGKRFHDTCSVFHGMGKLDRIAYVIDNDPNKWGKEVLAFQHRIPIVGPTCLKQEAIGDVAVILTTDKAVEVAEQLEKELGKRLPQCFAYPQYIKWYIPFIYQCFKILPLKNHIIFQGRNEPCENAIVLRDYMEEHELLKKHKIIWVMDEAKEGSKSEIHIDRNTLKKPTSFKMILKYCYYMSVAKYIMYENTPLFKSRRRQISIYLNHGTIPLKNVKGLLSQPEELDYALCPSKEMTELFCDQYNIASNKLLYLSSPRLDYLFKKENVLRELIHDKGSNKIIIWLPTFRHLKDTNRVDSVWEYPYGISLIYRKEDLERVNDFLKASNMMLIVKAHSRENERIELTNLSNIQVITDEMLMKENLILHEVLKDTDALITDYSGVAFDYILLDKPIAYAIDDMEAYKLGFAVKDPLEYMPGEKMKNVEDLMKFLQDVLIEKDSYYAIRNKLRSKIYTYYGKENAFRLLDTFHLTEG